MFQLDALDDSQVSWENGWIQSAFLKRCFFLSSNPANEMLTTPSTGHASQSSSPSHIVFARMVIVHTEQNEIEDAHVFAALEWANKGAKYGLLQWRPKWYPWQLHHAYSYTKGYSRVDLSSTFPLGTTKPWCPISCILVCPWAKWCHEFSSSVMQTDSRKLAWACYTWTGKMANALVILTETYASSVCLQPACKGSQEAHSWNKRTKPNTFANTFSCRLWPLFLEYKSAEEPEERQK